MKYHGRWLWVHRFKGCAWSAATGRWYLTLNLGRWMIDIDLSGDNT